MKDSKQKGFTLIEIIIALVVLSILAVMTVSFSGNLARSVSPVMTLNRSADLQRGIDNLTRAYYNLPLPITHASLDSFQANLAANINVTGISVDAGRTKFITFHYDHGDYTEHNDGSQTAHLKVTLVNSAGQSVSTIFTTR
jgi:prepilin-type N-terminal cleavage/methylation domain-containing protein